MAGKIRVKLTPKIVFLTHTGNGNFTKSDKPAKNAFPAVNEVQISLEQNNGGTMPLQAGQRVPARLELLARLRNTTDPAAPYTLCGTLAGELSLQGTPAVPVLIAKRPKPSDPQQRETNFTPGTAAQVAQSDFLLSLTALDNTVQIVDAIKLPLPWIFSDTNPILQLNARLNVSNSIETNVTGTDANQPIEIPLQHDNVPDEGAVNQTKDHPLLKFYGVRNLYTMSLLPSPTRVKVSSAGVVLNVFLDASVTALLPAAGLPTLDGFVRAVLTDAGFANVNVDRGTTAVANFARLFKRRESSTKKLWHMSVNVQGKNETARADEIEKGGGVSIISSETVQMPFFDFYVVAQFVDPPASSPDELGFSESFTNPGTNKSVVAPIVLTAGASNLTGLRKKISSLDTPRMAMVVSQVICHEIGHSLGLRHNVTFLGSPPYTFKADGMRGVMGGAADPPPIPSGATATPFQFFGPVHQAVIRQFYL